MRYSFFGYGIGNRSVVKYLAKKGYDVFVSDLNEVEPNDRIEGVVYEKGNSERILDADKIVVSPSVSPKNELIREATRRGIPVVSDIELFYDTFKPKIVAVTGTNGKSTTVSLINRLLKTKYTSFLAGNIGIPIFDFAEAEYDFLVVEVSSFQLHYTETLKPFVAVFLNLTPDHLDWHGSFEDYKKDKYKIFKNQDRNDFSIINEDLKLPNNEAKKIIFSLKNPNCDFYVKDNVIYENFTPLFEVNTKLKGEHNLQNVLAATATARVCSILKEAIAEEIFEFEPLEHRLEVVDKFDDVEFINDSKSTTTDSTLKALTAYPNSVLILGGRRKGEDYESFINSIKSKVKGIVLIGESSNDFELYCKRYNIDYRKSKNMCDAVKKAFEMAKTMPTEVLLSPATASYGMFKNYKERGEEFKDCVKGLKNSRSF